MPAPIGQRLPAYMTASSLKREEFIHAVADIVLDRQPNDVKERCRARLSYGAGAPGLRGVTYYGRWSDPGTDEPIPFVEICALGEEHPIQLAGTTIHELGHVLAGFGAGHGKAWKDACRQLGLRHVRAAGTVYSFACFDPDIRHIVSQLIEKLKEGRPANGFLTVPRPCPMGIGTRGGKSRGKGSGSRLRKWVCECEKPVIARVASDDFKAHCDCCGSAFKRAD